MADKLRDEIREIKNMRQAQENELATIENAALKQRFQMALSKLVAQEQEKKEEVISIVLFIIISSIFNKLYSSMTKSCPCYDGHLWIKAEMDQTSRIEKSMDPSAFRMSVGIAMAPVFIPSKMDCRVSLSCAANTRAYTLV
jgi:hypothetical protein